MVWLLSEARVRNLGCVNKQRQKWQELGGILDPLT